MNRLAALSALTALCAFAAEAPAGQGRPAAAPRFDGNRAYEHVRRLVAIGPRPAGSEGIARARAYINDQIGSLGLRGVEHAFDAETPGGRVRMANISVLIPGARPERLIVGGHYDTKRFGQFRFVGANDGGSSAAFLIELARALRDRRGPLTIELVLFDGEEAVVDWAGTDHTYGSREYVAHARRDGSLAQIRAMVLVDMIGDRNLRIRREQFSTRWLTDLFWASAGRLGHSDVFTAESMAVEDDHLPFLEAGIPAVDLIDLEYPAWHTEADTIDQISAGSLQIVGDVLLDALPAVEARLMGR